MQQNLDNIKRPNTKWVFVKFFNVDVKVNCQVFTFTFNVATVAALAHYCSAAQPGAQVYGGNGSTGHLQ